ncbi:MAG: hypothetical protein WCQ50_01415 [Spirochaetota bacterium]
MLFDEVDVLQDGAMLSFLRQLRSGFSKREVGIFPVSVALVGMRDLRDYLMRSKDGVSLNPGRQKTWEERLTWELRETAGGGEVTLVGG